MIVPPQSTSRLAIIKWIVKREHQSANLADRVWTGRLVHEATVTWLLIVTEAHDQTREINRQLEAELERLKTAFARTDPMAIRGHSNGHSELNQARPDWH